MEHAKDLTDRIRALEAQVARRDAMLQRLAVVPVRGDAPSGLAARLHRGLDRGIRGAKRVRRAVLAVLDRCRPKRKGARDRWSERLDVAAALIADVPATGSGLDRFLAAASAPQARGAAWLGLLATLARYPSPEELERAERALRHGVDSLGVMLRALHEDSGLQARGIGLRAVPGRVLIDVTNTVRTDLHTGIQRVVKEAASRWLEDPLAMAVTWDPQRHALLELSPTEADRVRRWREHLPGKTGSAAAVRTAAAASVDVVVPTGATFLLPETVDDVSRAKCYRAMALGAGTHRLGIIGYDLVPITAVETVVIEHAGHFSAYLSFLKQCTHLSAISGTAATEFRSFCAALASQGVSGPEVISNPLPPTPHHIDDATLARVRTELQLKADDVIVLVVGSREPRKNHLAVLWVAEQLWTEGHDFHLVMVGGSAWNDADVLHEISRLQDLGHPLLTRTRATEEELFSLYQLASFTLFPSLYEGFGLPVVESLAAGTPVLTSNYGAMAEVATGGGALLADPRDWRSLLDAARRMLTDQALLTELGAQARARQFCSWSSYAADVWQHLVGRELGRASG